jgi:hypothetical protein
MKAILSALALMLIVSPAFADVTIELKGVQVNAKQSNGKNWDLKIPLKKGSELPDIAIEIKNGTTTVLKSQVTKNATEAKFSGMACLAKKTKMIEKAKARDCKIVVADAHAKDVTITVWDKDAAGGEKMGMFKIDGKSGDVTLKGDGVKGLMLTITTGKTAAAPAAAPAAAAPAAAPAAPAAEAAPAAK